MNIINITATTLLKDCVRQLAQYLRRHQIQKVLLGLSGGADSVLTFHLLRLAGDSLSRDSAIPFRLATAHVNFRLRGAESMRDENFVRSLLERFPTSAGVEICQNFANFDTLSYCRVNKVSVEMGARELRHNLFRRLAAEEGFDRIATGHNANDNEETLFLNLLRGSGIRGLKAMKADTGRIIRPLLGISRPQIHALLSSVYAAEGVELSDMNPGFVSDSSNMEDDVKRNFLRLSVIPLLESRWPGCHKSIQTTLTLLQEESQIVEHALADALKDSQAGLTWDAIETFPSPLSLIHAWISPLGGNTDIASEILAHSPSKAGKGAAFGQRWRLAGGTTLLATPSGILIEESSGDSLDPTFINPAFLKTDILTLHPELMTEIKRCPPDEVYLPGFPEKYEWRTPREGDRMRLFSKGSKLVSDILKEAEIPLSLRSQAPLLIDKQTGEIVWIPGIRRGAAALIKPDITTPVCHFHQ